MPTSLPNLVRKPAKPTKTDKRPSEREVDEALDDSFPASDPPAFGGPTGAGAPDDAKSVAKPRG